MTPEQRAAQPQHIVTPAFAGDAYAAVLRMLATVREMRRKRREDEYPLGHSERPMFHVEHNGGGK